MQFIDEPNQQLNLRRVLSEQCQVSVGDLLMHNTRFFPNLVGRIVRGSKCDYKILKKIGHPGAFGCGWEAIEMGGKGDAPERAFLKS